MTPAYAEEAVLAGVMAANETFHEVAALLGEEHFTSPARRRIWSAIRDRVTAGEPAGMVTLLEDLPNDSTELFSIATSYATSSGVAHYGAMVRENWRRREAAGIAQKLLAGARDGEEGAVDAAIGALLNLNAAVTACEFTGKQSLRMAWDQAEAAYMSGGQLPGITTGLNALDGILGGWHDSDLTIIGARPAVGKTALLVCMAEAAVSAGVPAGFISAEQPTAQIGLRRLAQVSGVGAAALRAGRVSEDDWTRITAGIQKSRDRPLWIYDRSSLTLDELVCIARKWKHAHGIKILFVDYAQRIRVPGADRITEVATVAQGLKNIARTLNIPVVSLAQVKAAVEQRTDKRPLQGDLANSDELVREADQILMLYRDEVYNRDSQDKGVAEILIEKNRHGPTGFKKLAFLEETMRFVDLSREHDF